jgi:hypothetical protein
MRKKMRVRKRESDVEKTKNRVLNESKQKIRKN